MDNGNQTSSTQPVPSTQGSNDGRQRRRSYFCPSGRCKWSNFRQWSKQKDKPTSEPRPLGFDPQRIFSLFFVFISFWSQVGASFTFNSVCLGDDDSPIHFIYFLLFLQVFATDIFVLLGIQWQQQQLSWQWYGREQQWRQY